jgi:phosphatidylinositol alpha-1,6-mannosyltransferase
MKKRFPSVRYYCVGRDVRNEYLKQQAKKLGVSNQVVFIPPCKIRAELGQWYSQADIFMLLSENQPNGDLEGFGIVALEANYFGVPVIGAKGCGVEDAVQDGVSGILVDPSNPNEIVQAVSTIMADWQGFSSRARIHALKFDWNKVKVQYMELLN